VRSNGWHWCFWAPVPQLHGSEELAELGITVPDPGWRYRGSRSFALMWAAAGIARWTADARRQLAARGRHMACQNQGLIGFGGIAAEVARIALGGGMRVIAWNRTPKNRQGRSSTRELLTEAM
jgi:D-3-phosphoglycerate dehydrogenase